MKLRLVSLIFFLSSRVNYSLGTPPGATKLPVKSINVQDSAADIKENGAYAAPAKFQQRVLTGAKGTTLFETLLVDPNSAGEVLSSVSKIFQKELEQLQNPPNCDNITTLICGHSSKCGLTCQLHNRAACVIYSYVLKAPLIHEDRKNWPFSKPWSAAFLPMGSRCKPNNRTINVNWKDHSYIHKRRTKANKKNPLKNGLPIRKDLAEVVEKFHPSPFLWWVGQFMKYVLRLSQEQVELINKSRLNLKKYRMKSDSAQVVGIHVRRTDKMGEVRYANHSIKDYMAAAKSYFEKYYRFQTRPKSVMVATDDPSTIKEIQAKYKRPEWNVYSVNPQNSILLDSQKVRRHHLMETLKDFILLSEADYIVCGFSSNVCRLLLELKVTSQLNATEVVQSLDDGYCLGLSGVYCPEVIVKV